jgi:hypothetical protein
MKIIQSENVDYQMRKCFGKPFKMCTFDHLYNINTWYIQSVSGGIVNALGDDVSSFQWVWRYSC